MEQSFWLEKWKIHDTKFDQGQPNPHLIQYLSSLNLKNNARVFVPLCGKSIDMLWLKNKGFQIVGVELSSIACESFFNVHQIPFKKLETNRLIQYDAENITLYATDFFDISNKEIGHIDAIYDRAALIALPERLRKNYTNHLRNIINENTKILLISSTYNQNEMAGPPFSVSEHEVLSLFKHFGEVKKLYDQEAKLIPEHLKEKGLTQASEQVYFITFN
ncbi:MAG: thiopurine S-methyltransferase [Gammaproteobacteria bacterium]